MKDRDPRGIRLLTTIREELQAFRAENQSLHAHTDVMLVEAISRHNTDPHAHRSLFAELERRLERLERTHDDEPGE